MEFLDMEKFTIYEYSLFVCLFNYNYLLYYSSRLRSQIDALFKYRLLASARYTYKTSVGNHACNLTYRRHSSVVERDFSKVQVSQISGPSQWI